MSTAKAVAQVKYVTNAYGQTTDVIVPIEVWQPLLEAQELENPEPDAIAASIHRALADVQAGRTKPIAELWDSLDAE